MNLIGQNIKDAVMMIPNIVSGAIAAAFKSIGDMLGNAIRGLVPGGSTAPAPNGSPWNHQLPGPEQHSSLVPPPRHMAINIPVMVQMDSRKMASTVMNQVVAAAT
jgi:hypothetical protein